MKQPPSKLGPLLVSELEMKNDSQRGMWNIPQISRMYANDLFQGRQKRAYPKPITIRGKANNVDNWQLSVYKPLSSQAPISFTPLLSRKSITSLFRPKTRNSGLVGGGESIE
jgi:hypothetical protein